jgi:hypothetical protein
VSTDQEKGLGHLSLHAPEDVEQKLDALAQPDEAEEQNHLGVRRNLQLGSTLGHVGLGQDAAAVRDHGDTIRRHPARDEIVLHARAVHGDERSALGHGPIEGGRAAPRPVARAPVFRVHGMGVDDRLDAQLTQPGQKAREAIVVAEEILGILDDQHVGLRGRGRGSDGLDVVFVAAVARDAFIRLGLGRGRSDLGQDGVAQGSMGTHAGNEQIRVKGQPVSDGPEGAQVSDLHGGGEPARKLARCLMNGR